MLKGEKVQLRLVKEKDIDKLFDYMTDLSNRGGYFPITMTSQTIFKKIFYETGFWNEEFGRLLIVDNMDNILGSIYYFKIAIYSDAIEIGYILFDKENEGKGYTSEALRLMVNYLFSIKTINRIQLRIAPQHEASKKVALKCGFQFNVKQKQIMYLRGQHIDLDEYVILRQDYEKLYKLGGHMA